MTDRQRILERVKARIASSHICVERSKHAMLIERYLGQLAAFEELAAFIESMPSPSEDK